MGSEIAKWIDHTLLRPDASEKEIVTLCEEALKYGFASVCINSCRVPLAAGILSGSAVKVCTVIGFPLGAGSSEAKVSETAWALGKGASEIDMVMNVGAVKDGDYEYVKNEVRSVAETARAAANEIVVKVILEMCLLEEEEKRNTLEALINTGADFVKTSTGFSSGGATVADVRLMAEKVADRMRVKASGGIRDYGTFKAMMAAGASRIGTSSGVKIVGEAEYEEGCSFR